MKKIALLAGAAGLVAALATAPVFAQPGPGGAHAGQHGGPGRGAGGFAMGEAFARADANNDGRVTRDEGWTFKDTPTTEIYTNRDGGVTFEEMRAYAQARMGNRTPSPERVQRAEQQGQAMFRFLDANGDSRVTLEEMRPFAEAMFRARDTNNDGALSRDEVMPRRDRGPAQGQAPTQRN